MKIKRLMDERRGITSSPSTAASPITPHATTSAPKALAASTRDVANMSDVDSDDGETHVGSEAISSCTELPPTKTPKSALVQMKGLLPPTATEPPLTSTSKSPLEKMEGLLAILAVSVYIYNWGGLQAWGLCDLPPKTFSLAQ